MLRLYRLMGSFNGSRGGAAVLRVIAVLLVVGTTSISWGWSATLKPKTLDAWNEYVRVTEARIERELESPPGFLVQDFQTPGKARADRLALIGGDVRIVEMETRKARNKKIDIPSGTIHHWRGSIFIPNASLDRVLTLLRSPMLKQELPPDVIDSMILERGEDSLQLYLKLIRKKFVTVMFNTNHLVKYSSHGPRRASSRSVSTRIAELVNGNTPREREKPIGKDRGFLWRMNSYWRFEEVEGGVLVECESLTLSRGIPSIVRPFVNPIVDGVAKDSMRATLIAMKERISNSVPRLGAIPAAPAS